MSITNKEALRDKIHEIHNLLRNNGAGYGMNALKVFNIIYGLKKIEELNLYEKLGIENDKCRFSYLLELSNKNKDELLASTIKNDVLDYFHSKDTLRKFLFYEIPINIKGKAFCHLIKQINSISDIEKSCNVQLSGKIYEYFIGRDESAISELGAYFTDRHIVNYIYDKINIETNDDGSIPSMVDMFGGSGGFTTGYIHYLNQKYNSSESEESKDYKINWSTELSKIHHYDMNEDVIKSAGLEFLCLTKELPDMNNLKYKNSFLDEFNNQKFSYIVTNPPYGGDKTKKTDANNKLEKIKAYILNELKNLDVSKDAEKIAQRKAQLKSIEAQEKQDKLDADKAKVCLESCSTRINKYAREHKLKGTDKEACSLILMMDLLAENGTAVGVLKEGVFFDKVYKDLRACLIKNFNVTEVISVPQDQFENTSTKTSIIIFKNPKNEVSVVPEVSKTSEVKFYDLVIEKYEEDVFGTDESGNIVLLENKGDIKRVYDTLVSEASAEEILSNSKASLNSKVYSKKEIKPGKGYQLIKLGDICEFLPKSKRAASFGKNEGKYNFYTSSQKIQNCDEADYDKKCVLIGTGGNSCIHLTANKFSCSADSLLFHSKKITNEYIYYIMLSLWDIFTNKMTGSTIKHVTKDMLTNFKIPIPESQEKLEYWVSKISTIHNETIKREDMLKQYENFVSNRVKEISEKEDCEEVELGSICEIQDGYEFKNEDLTIDIKNVPLIRATYIENKNISNYIKYNKKFEKYEIIKNDIIFSQVGNVGNVCKYKESFISYNKRNAFRIRSKDIQQDFLYYYFKSDYFKNNIKSNGTIVQFISIPDLKKILIKIPKNKQLIIDLEQYFNAIEQLQGQIKYCETLYEQYIQELAAEAIDKA